ncbi:hypothetical protein QR680_004755 [Steinernema hermaphroditum]|uniref:G-protein coupled receptors family 1 profile domain-containing protein n=1 Tax=Steinernema hermaphroditum TaxID=289476 RepID=A0AA39HRX0_9BILA|nr:hypothetical protein QR680_004755 [Steinernema hermaphroditum]
MTYDDNLAASIILVIGLLGAIINLSTALMVFRIKKLNNTFGFMCSGLGMADSALLLFFVCWSAPITYSNYTPVLTTLNRKMGHSILYFWFVSLYYHLIIAANRLIAMFFPINYSHIFSGNRSRIYVLIPWMLALAHMVVYFFDGCDFYFDSTSYLWTFREDTECGRSLAYFIDLIYGCTVMGVTASVDIITFIRLRMYKNKLSKTINHRDRKRNNREIRFFAQSCVTTLMFILMLISFHLFSKYAINKWAMFACTTLAWELTHVTDGLILLLFNSEFWELLKNPSRIIGTSHNSTQLFVNQKLPGISTK